MEDLFPHARKNLAQAGLVYGSDKASRKRRYSFDEFEADEILRKIEEEYSPLKDFNDATEELKNEK